MLTDFSIIEGEYLSDLLYQPEALRNTVAGLRPLPELAKVAADLSRGSLRRIVLTGMGSSYYALYPMYLQLINHGWTALLIETSELLGSMTAILDPDTLVIAVSQSGRSAETVRLLEFGPRRPYVIGITNTPDSPLACKSNATILTDAGPESCVSCKTYLASLAALEWVGSALCGKDPIQTKDDLERAAPAVQEYLSRWREYVRILCSDLKGVEDLFLAGRGASLAAAGTGGLILKESTHVHAEGMSSAAFRHGPFEMLSDEVYVVVFGGSGGALALNEGLVKDIREAGGRAALVTEGAEAGVFRLPAVPPSIRPVVEILSVQMISLALAASRGREPGRFRLVSKVTTVE
jgi:glucosamine--fructose-6-phosphate aminotransferase (isomerizing)